MCRVMNMHSSSSPFVQNIDSLLYINLLFNVEPTSVKETGKNLRINTALSNLLLHFQFCESRAAAWRHSRSPGINSIKTDPLFLLSYVPTVLLSLQTFSVPVHPLLSPGSLSLLPFYGLCKKLSTSHLQNFLGGYATRRQEGGQWRKRELGLKTITINNRTQDYYCYLSSDFSLLLSSVRNLCDALILNLNSTFLISLYLL